MSFHRACCCTAPDCCAGVASWPDAILVTLLGYLEEGERRYCGGLAGSAGELVEYLGITVSFELTLTRNQGVADPRCWWGNELTDPGLSNVTGTMSLGSTSRDVGTCQYYVGGVPTFAKEETRNVTITADGIDYANAITSPTSLYTQEAEDGTCYAVLRVGLLGSNLSWLGTCGDFGDNPLTEEIEDCYLNEDSTSGTDGAILFEAVWTSQHWTKGSPPAVAELTWTLTNGATTLSSLASLAMCTQDCIGVVPGDCAAAGTCIYDALWRGCNTTGSWPNASGGTGKTYCNRGIVTEGTLTTEAA